MISSMIVLARAPEGTALFATVEFDGHFFQEKQMNGLLLFTAAGPLLVLSSHGSPEDDVFLGKLKAKGIEKFMAYPLDTDKLKKQYGGHFAKVVQDLHETDDLRVLDYNGHRIFEMIDLDALGDPIIHEPARQKNKVYMD